MKETDGDLFSFLSQGKKLYIQQSHSVFRKEKLNNTTIVRAQDIESVQSQQFDLVILSYPCERSLAQKSIGLLSNHGQIIFCAQNQSFMRRIAWLLSTNMLKKLCKLKKISQHRLYYISPGFYNVVQVVSNHNFLSQQYFRQHYHWHFTKTQSIMKRLIKHLVFKTNTFYLLEKYSLLEFQKC